MNYIGADYLFWSVIFCSFLISHSHTEQRLLINLLKGCKVCVINIIKVLLHTNRQL